MKILRSYVLKECVIPFFLALGVLTSVFLLGNLMQLAHLVINKGVSLTSVGKLFMFYIPVLLGYTLPIACLVAVILGFSRLSADNEILAMRASGIYLKKILAPLFLIGIIFGMFTFLLNDRIIPYAHHEQRKMLKNLGAKNPTAMLEPGIFISAFEGQILFIHKIEDNLMYNVTIYQPQPDGKPTRTIIAKKGEFSAVPGEDKILLKLLEGTSDEPDINNPNNFYKLNFDKFFITLNLSEKNKKIDKKPKSMTLAELKPEIERLQMLFVDVSRMETEYLKRIAWSFAPLLFVLLGFPMAIITNRREKTANVLMAMIAVTVYYVLTLGSEALAMEEIIPKWIIMWMPNFIAAIVAIVLNFKICTR